MYFDLATLIFGGILSIQGDFCILELEQYQSSMSLNIDVISSDIDDRIEWSIFAIFNYVLTSDILTNSASFGNLKCALDIR